FTQRDGIKIVAIATGAQQTLWGAGLVTVRCLKFSDDGLHVLAGMNDRTARMWSAASGEQLLVVDAGDAPQGIAWSESRQLVAAADREVRLWQCTCSPVCEKE